MFEVFSGHVSLVASCGDRQLCVVLMSSVFVTVQLL